MTGSHCGASRDQTAPLGSTVDTFIAPQAPESQAQPGHTVNKGAFYTDAIQVPGVGTLETL